MKILIRIGFILIFIGIFIFSFDKVQAYIKDTKEVTITNEEKNAKLEDVSYNIVDDNELNYNPQMYANKYDKEILTRDNNEDYKIIKIQGTTIGADYHYEGYMAVIYDPSKVKIAKSTGAGITENSYGQILSDISKNNNAVIAMNAGGFYDQNWNSNGGIPHGPVIIDGKIDTDYKRGDEGGGIIGFNKENKLVLKRMSADQAIAEGIRDAVDWGPYLIVNGKNQFKDVNYYTWVCGRTAIGQRKDGIVLMLVIDGLQKHSKGASYADMAAIMEKYGAYNASNLDGGTSTAMTLNHQYINSPWNGYRRTIRWLPNAWIMEK